MFQIPGETLWLGHAGDAKNLRSLFDAGITALVDLALNDPAPAIPHELIYCRIPLVDGAGNSPEMLRLAIQTTVTLLQIKMPTLISCSAGLSRSPAIAAAALALVLGSSPTETLRQIADQHPLDVTPGFWHDVEEVAKSMRST